MTLPTQEGAFAGNWFFTTAPILNGARDLCILNLPENIVASTILAGHHKVALAAMIDKYILPAETTA